MQKLFYSLVIIFITIFGVTSIAQASINFPNFNPVAFNIFGFGVRWYGLFYLFGLVGILALNAYLLHLDHKKSDFYNKNMTANQFSDIAVNTFLAAIIGGRIGYVLFYNFSYYLAHPIEIFYLHSGGMSFHGGFLGAAFAVWYQTRKQGNFWQVADLGATVIPVALGIGRIGNFINDELWGRATNVAWAVKFPTGGYIPRHPSQLYEALLEGLVLLIIMIWLRTRRLDKPGLIAGAFVAGYGLSRFIVEFFREPDVQIGYYLHTFTQGQLLSVPMIIVGVYIMMTSGHRNVTYHDLAKTTVTP